MFMRLMLNSILVHGLVSGVRVWVVLLVEPMVTLVGRSMSFAYIMTKNVTSRVMMVLSMALTCRQGRLLVL